MDTFVRDRRAAHRHEFVAPLRLRLRQSSAPECQAESVNLSTRGIFLKTDSDLSIGAPVELHLTMPEEITGEPTSVWRCTGSVIWVEPPYLPAAPLAVGIQFDWHEPAR